MRRQVKEFGNPWRRDVAPTLEDGRSCVPRFALVPPSWSDARALTFHSRRSVGTGRTPVVATRYDIITIFLPPSQPPAPPSPPPPKHPATSCTSSHTVTFSLRATLFAQSQRPPCRPTRRVVQRASPTSVAPRPRSCRCTVSCVRVPYRRTSFSVFTVSRRARTF